MTQHVLRCLIRFGESVADIAISLLAIMLMAVVAAQNLLVDLLRGRIVAVKRCAVAAPRAAKPDPAARWPSARWTAATAILGWATALLTAGAIGMRLTSPPAAGADGEAGWVEPLAMLSLLIAALISFVLLGRAPLAKAANSFWRLFAAALLLGAADDVLDLHESVVELVVNATSVITGQEIKWYAGDCAVAVYVIPIAVGLAWKFRPLLRQYLATTAMLAVAAALFGIMVEFEVVGAAPWQEETLEAAAAGAILIGVCLALPRTRRANGV